MSEFLDALVAERHTPQRDLRRPVWGGQAGLEKAAAEAAAHAKAKREREKAAA